MNIRYRQLPVQFFILFSFALMPSWKAWVNAPKPFTATYVLGFVVVAPMLLAILAWVLAGLPNLKKLWDNPWRLVWASAVGAFVLWAWLSQVWNFVSAERIGVAQNGALQTAIVFGFAIVCLCCPPKPQYLLTVLIGSLVVHALIGGLQVIAQSEIGLNVVGELRNIDPLKSGVSVIQAGEIRWLRPYGLVPHPNVYAGVIIVGLFALIPLLLHEKRIIRVVSLILLTFAWWMLLLTFSRGAWIAFVGASLGILWFILRQKKYRQRILTPFLLLIVVSSLFFALYRPFIFARAGVGEENTELRSISDRIVFTEIAFEVIYNAPVQGIGIGNFPWYASWYLSTKTDFDLRGTNVHQIALTVITELGFVGFALFALILSLGVGMSVQKIWQEPQNLIRITCLASVLAFGIVGLVDHYPYTLVHFFAMWMGLLAFSFADVPSQKITPLAEI